MTTNRPIARPAQVGLPRRRLLRPGTLTCAPRGQSLVEFALMLPLLLILLLGVADFGRVFADGIALEAASRNAAEAAAQEYMQFCSKYANSCADLVPSDYADLHELALDVGCREAERLTNLQETGGNCTNPVIAVCVHDDAATDGSGCGQEGLAGSVPADCNAMNDASSWSAARAGPVDGRPYVEVRLCYLFEPLIPLTETWFGNVWMQRENNFSVTNY